MMNPFRTLAFSLGLALFASSAARGADPQTIVVDVPKGDQVTVRIPEGWKTKGVPTPAGAPPTVGLSTRDESVALQVTFIPDVEKRFATKESLERVATEGGQRFAAGSTEKRVDLKALESKNVRGVYATFTDAELVGVKELR